MSISRRDTGAVSGLSGVSIGLLVLGLISLAVASCVGVAVYIQLRKTKKLRQEVTTEAKLAKIGQPVLQQGPFHELDSALDMSRMTNQMKERYAQRQLGPVSSLSSRVAYQNSNRIAQSSSGSGSSTSSGPIPPSSSEATHTSKAKSHEQASSTFHSFLDSQRSIPAGEPRLAPADVATRPSFARETRSSRVAIPSALLRGLGDLPQLPAPGSTAVDSAAHVQFRTDAESTSVGAGRSTCDRNGDLESQIERSGWLKSAIPAAFVGDSTSRKMTFDLEAQLQNSSERRTTGGPSRVTVDYFNTTGRRKLAPAAPESNTSGKRSVAHQRNVSTASSNSVSPHKKPDFVLPPLPTSGNKGKGSDLVKSSSAFRPLSLGLVLDSTFKTSSFNASSMFGDLPFTFWNDTADVPLSRSPSKGSGEERQKSGQMSALNSSAINISQLPSHKFVSFASLGSMANDDAYDGASLYSNEDDQADEKSEAKAVEHEAAAPPKSSSIERPYGSPQVPFMTIHHRAVFPDQLKRNSKKDQVNIAQRTPDLSMVHEAPLPPATLPPPSLLRGGFASSLRAKLTLNRSKAASPVNSITPSPILLNGQAITSQSDTARPQGKVRPASGIPSIKSPTDTLNSFGPPVETWKVCTENRSSTPSFLAPTTTLGLGLCDVNGVALDRQMSSKSSVDHEEHTFAQSPILPSVTPARLEARESNGEEAQMSYSKRVSALERHQTIDVDCSPSFRSVLHQGAQVDTPPMGRVRSPQFATLSTLSPKVAHTPTLIGNDWALNRQHHGHKSSVASSYCDTISTCLTGASERMGDYDNGNAQNHRAKLLQSIQKNKTAVRASLRSSGVNQVEKSFFSHSARVSAASLQTVVRSPPPVIVAETSTAVMFGNATASKKPSYLTIQVQKERPHLEDASEPRTAPLTPPLTPGERTPTIASIKPLLAEAALLEEEMLTAEQEKANRLAKLRPLSLANHQQQIYNFTTPTVRFNKTSSSLHKSQSSSQSSSNHTSSTTAPSASSSNSSLFQAHASSNRLSFSTFSSHTKFPSAKRLSTRSGVAPIGVLPTLSAEGSPSFLTSSSTPTPRPSFAAANSAFFSSSSSSPRSTPRHNNWHSTPSPRISRASVNVGSVPYHSPLSVDTLASPYFVRGR
ncbi:hypothetical protein CBS101457_002679 [Exobasidium rhododendri]|nr:hypothetical protein CBS101457_002679 [Exobasidium rhododendri]